MTEPARPIFLSYASQDTDIARRIAESLRSAGIEVWFDQTELRGGDSWDRLIRKQILDCSLFVPIISTHSDARTEGYFRREWRLAVERTSDMADDTPFLLPILVDDTQDAHARVPDQFRRVQWTRLPGGVVSPIFVDRVSTLLYPPKPPASIEKPLVNMQIERPLSGPVQKGGSPAQRPRVLLWLIAAAALSGGYILAHRFVPSAHRTASDANTAAPAVLPQASPEKSIAVLPFVDMSEKHDQEYFSDGLSEELIDHLARSATLKVISRTSCFYFKGKQATIGEIAKLLGVSHVLEGSVRKAGNSVRITAQLIRASDGVHLWSQTYDRPLRDIFKLQDEIATAVEKELQIAIAGGASPQIRRPPNPDAYNLVLLARAQRSFNAASIDRSIGYYQEALKLDSAYAVAWAGLAHTLVRKTQFTGSEETKPLLAQAGEAAANALTIDPGLADAYVELGAIRLIVFDWNAAETQFSKANALKQGSADSYLTVLHTWQYGPLPEAVAFYQAALRKDPLDTSLYTKFGQVLLASGRFVEAEKAFRRVIELAPDFTAEHLELSRTLLFSGQPKAALIEAAKEPSDFKTSLEARIYWAMGRRVDADAALERIKAAEANDSDPVDVAEVLAYRGDFDAAFDWLNRAFEARDSSLPANLKVDLEFKGLRGDARYKTLLHKLNLPE